MRVIGVDEAGKGPVLGPMVVSGVSIEYNENKDLTNKPDILNDLDIKDSKKLSEGKRTKLAREIKRRSKENYSLLLRAPHIDRLRENKTMNKILVEAFSVIIDKMDGEVAIIDSADTNPERYSRKIKTKIDKDIEIISEHKADEKYPIVSSASILAKDKRDREIKEIERIINKKIGKGYPIDKKTTGFLKNWIKNKSRPPVFCRKTWKTTEDIINNLKQKNLNEF